MRHDYHVNFRTLPASMLLALLCTACAQLPANTSNTPSFAMPPAHRTDLDIALEPIEAAHPGASGFMVLAGGREAFAARAHLTASAQRSLDVQTYIWQDDLTGRYLLYELLQAADRGVRVRLLLDDLSVRMHNDALAALDRHANIEIRMFNPMASRHGKLSLLGEGLRSFKRLNHRMHIKNWIADNRIAIAGGRNVGDEYFAANEATNFADAELVMMGPAVRDGSAQFDQYWNFSGVYPIATLNPDLTEHADQDALRAALDNAAKAAESSEYAEALRNDDMVRKLARGEVAPIWERDYQLVVDDPRKIYPDTEIPASAVVQTLTPLLQKAQHDVVIISPYFVPGKSGAAALIALAQSGVQVRVLTNSLAANDVAAVHGGYARYRKQLLEGGVQLWELKPRGDQSGNSSYLGSSSSSLHAKAFVFDKQGLVIGSYNLDPRSTQLNAEMIVYVNNAALAQQFGDSFTRQVGGDSAWRVSLVDGKLQWSDGESTLTSEPQASLGRRFQAWLAKVLPVEGML